MPLRAGMSLDHFNAIGAAKFLGVIGVRVTALGEGLLGAEFTIRPDLLAPNGFLHAGTVVTLADTAAGYACIAHLPAGASGFTTIELKSNFLGTALEGVVRAEARAVHLGRTTHVWDANVRHAESGRTLALFRCTQMVLWPKPQ